MKKLIINGLATLFALLAGTLIVSCDNSGTKYISNLTYNGDTITWDSVKNAKNYIIRINDGKEILVSQQNKIVSYDYDSQGEDFKFYVEAVIKEDSDKNPMHELTFENIGTVTNLNVENGNLVWDYLEAADEYEIMLDGNILNGKIGINSYALNPGSFAAKVRGVKNDNEVENGNNKYYSCWSNAFNGTLLSSPKNLKYNSECFTWDNVDGAVSYTIKIGNEEFNTNEAKYEFATSNEDLEISVKALGDNKATFDSSYCDKKTYSYIPAITGLQVEDGTLKWNKPNNAIKYKIKINGIVQDGYLTMESYDKLQAGTSYRIALLPIGGTEFYYSTWSNEQTINILRSPSVSFNNNIVQWNQVTGADGYNLKVVKDGKVQASIPLSNEVYTYDYEFSSVGKYEVSVKATMLNTSNGIYESKYSKVYNVERLNAPSNVVVQNQPLEANQLMVTCSGVVNATKYVLYADDVEIAKNNEPTFNVDITRLNNSSNEAVINFKIKTIGNISANCAYLDSLVNAEFSVTKLATPQNVSINGSTITWNQVANTNKYIVTIDGDRTEVTSTSFTLTDLSSGNHSIYVQAMGNSNEVITSSYSNELEINKLAKPVIKIEKDNATSKYYLSWNAISGATAYKVSVAGTNYDAMTNKFDISGYESYFAEGVGSQLSVYAIGNGTTIVNSDVSNTKTLVRYSTPNNLGLSGDLLTWTANNVDSVEPTSYIIDINGDEYYLTSNSYQLSLLSAGNYTIKVKVNGDYSNTIDSPYTNEFYFTKLEKVSNISFEGDKIKWDSVPGAVGYQVKLSNDSTPMIVTNPEVEVNYKSAGEYAITIITLGNGVTSANSDSLLITQVVKAITQPVLSEDLNNSNSFTLLQSGNRITITIKENENATAYKLIVGGREITQVSNVFVYDLLDSGIEYEIQVKIVGEKFDENGVYHISSNSSPVVKVSY